MLAKSNTFCLISVTAKTYYLKVVSQQDLGYIQKLRKILKIFKKIITKKLEKSNI